MNKNGKQGINWKKLQLQLPPSSQLSWPSLHSLNFLYQWYSIYFSRNIFYLHYCQLSQYPYIFKLSKTFLT